MHLMLIKNSHGGTIICLMKFDSSIVSMDLMNDIEVINDEILVKIFI